MSCWRQAVTTVTTTGLDSSRPMRSLDLGLYELSTNDKFVVGGWGGVGGVGGLGVIIESNLNRVRLSCYWVGFILGQYIQVSKGDVWG